MVAVNFPLADLDKFWWETVISHCSSYEVAKDSGCIRCVQHQIWKVLQENLKSCQEEQFSFMRELKQHSRSKVSLKNKDAYTRNHKTRFVFKSQFQVCNIN